MKVAELIEALKGLDPALTVMVVSEGGRLLPLSGTVSTEMVFAHEIPVIGELEVAGISLARPCNTPQTVV